MRYARIFFIIVILFCGFEAVRLWFLSPDVMTAHFNVQGNPDRFVPKLIFFGYQAKTVCEATVDRLSSFAAQMMIPVMIGIFVLSFLMIFWLARSFRLPTNG